MKTEHIAICLAPGTTGTLMLEPSGMVLALEGGVATDVVFEGPDEGAPEVEEGTDGVLTVYGWPGSTVHVIQDGREV